MDNDRRVGALLRDWRLRRKLSQLELSVQSGISTRHVSFVETGRTIPSPAMIERFAEHLGIPLRERNRLLVAAGHAPTYQHRALDDPDLTHARTAVRRVLDAHKPFPALAIDRQWNLLFANAAAEVFFEDVSAELLEPPINMMRIGLHPKGFASRVRNIEQVRGFLLTRLARQAAESGDPELIALHEELSAFGRADGPVRLDPADIALPIHLRHRDAELSLFNTIMRFGAAFDVTLDEIAIESYFPADAATAAYLTELVPVAGP
ncbi:helix-turn-helix transcriptional regulator [Nocardia sp. NBC_00565]|uniref:helix-turn-helix domain-containing protein n=1 Tax=Nocardia sp. NBC_00565 TaxID=2975993 RepID=UPI002E823BDB|nr:helix-turn-helix transcriptional regulator [Nocardia sp. NBC_00565]WUC07042.1 helix-turn-helix transcriptional regulator [Nocardia sp. NBC_00565]